MVREYSKLKLENHGQFLAGHLSDCYESYQKKYVALVCEDGVVSIGKDILASQITSKTFVRTMKSNNEDEELIIIIPDVTASCMQHLVKLLYTGTTGQLSETNIDGIKTASELLKFDTLNLTVVEEVIAKSDFYVDDNLSLTIESVEAKSKKRKKPPNETDKQEEEEESSDVVRRSARYRHKNSKLEEYDTSYKRGNQEFFFESNADVNTDYPEPRTSLECHPKRITDEVSKLPKFNQRVQVCLICGENIFGKKAGFTHHQKYRHSKGSFSCEYCAETFTSGIALHNHAREKTHADPKMGLFEKSFKEATKFKCDVGSCTAVFETFNYFQSHTIKEHDVFPLKCDICEKRYKEMSTFKNHMEAHEGVLKYECDVCQKKFVSKERLLAHRRLHLGRRFACRLCDYKGRSSTALRNHHVMIHDPKRFKCDYCLKKFASKQNLEHHIQTHTGKPSFKCVPCDMYFKRHHHFKAHLKTATHRNRGTGLDKFGCELCSVKYPDEQIWNRHLMTKEHVQKVNEKFNAGEEVPERLLSGYKTSVSLDHLNNEQHLMDQEDEENKFDEELITLTDQPGLFSDDHVEFIVVSDIAEDVTLTTSHPDEVKLSDAATAEDSKAVPHTKRTPEATSTTQEQLENPQSLALAKANDEEFDWRLNFKADVPFKGCYICCQRFLGLHQLTKHLRIHQSGPWDCQICPKNLNTGLLLHDHYRQHYRDEAENRNDQGSSHKCQLCSLTFPNVKSYTEHSLSVHSQKPFQCSECDIGYMHKANLDDHMKAKHRGSQSPTLPCDQCGKTFLTKAGLYVHRREQHLLGDSRKVKCNICNLWYKGKRNLKKHKETHGGPSVTARFQCLYCHKTFRTKNSLVVHERVHTGETPFTCQLCQKKFKRSHHLYSHLKCADHAAKIAQWEAEGKPLPDPVFTIAASATKRSVPQGPDHKSIDFSTAVTTPQPIYMQVTETDGSNTVQVVVPSDGLEAEQLLQSAVLLTTSTDDYPQFATT